MGIHQLPISITFDMYTFFVHIKIFKARNPTHNLGSNILNILIKNDRNNIN